MNKTRQDKKDLRIVCHENKNKLEVCISRLVNNEIGGFKDFYDQVAPLIYGITRKVLQDPSQAEEVTQEVFLEIWRSAHKFNPEKGSVKSWVAVIAHRRAVDRVRSEQASRSRDDNYYQLKPTSIDIVAEEATKNFNYAELSKAINNLTEPQRQALELAYYQGYTYREVAFKLGEPAGTVKTRIRDAIIKLRKQL